MLSSSRGRCTSGPVTRRTQAVTQHTQPRWEGVRLRLLVLAPLLAVSASLLPQAGAATTKSPQGVDVSKYQHDTGKLINWAAVKRSGQTN